MTTLRKIICILLAILVFCLPAFAVGNESASVFDETGAVESGVRIALIDTGVSSLAVDDEKIVEGRNYILPEDSTEDRVGHGTAIASLLVGSADGGIEGACSEAVLVPLVYYTLTENGEMVKGDLTLLAQIVRDAVDVYDCRIINISSGASADEPSLRDAVAYAEKCGAVVVSAVGNDYASATGMVYYPAGYETVIGVGALGEDGGPADFSQRGAAVLLCAPGVRLRAANMDGSMRTATGTSGATALVSGAAARLLAAHPELTPEQVRSFLTASAKNLCVDGWDADSGWGALRPDDAISYAAADLRFEDIDLKAWYMDDLCFVLAEDLMSGSDSTHFDPTGTTTREMVVTILHRLEGEPAPTAGNPFADVADGKWYTEAVLWAAQNKIVEGYDATHFGPDDTITREQLAAILWRYAKYEGYDMTNAVDLSEFSDNGEISTWAQVAMSWANASGLINGKGGSILDPKGAAERCQVAAILHRFCESVAK